MLPYSTAKKLSFLPLLLLLTVVIHIPVQDVSAHGLNSAHSIAAWYCVALQALLLIISRRKSIIALKPFYSGLLLLSLILMNVAIWSSAERLWQINALPRVMFIFSLTLFFWVMLQRKVSGSECRLLIGLVALGALIEAVIVFLQLYAPNFAYDYLCYNSLAAEGRPLGMFSQVNLLGSFLATGAGAALWSAMQCRRPSAKGGWLVGLFFIAIALYLTHSRTGWIGAALSVTGICVFFTSSRSCALFAVAAVSGFAALVLVLLPVPPKPVALTSSEQTQVLQGNRSLRADSELNRMRRESLLQRQQMLVGSLLLIKQHPWFGNGAGSFEATWPVALEKAGQRSVMEKTLTHPHNEALFVLAEGGVVAFAGLMICAFLYCLPVIKGANYHRRLWVLTLPITLHCMTEYPFYLSAVHAVLWVILLRVAWPAHLLQSWRLSSCINLSLKSLGVVLCFASLAFLTTGWQTRRILLEAEESGMRNPSLLHNVPNALAQYDRLQFNLCVSELILFNHSRLLSYLQRFESCAGQYLLVHNDANMTESMVQIAKLTGRKSVADYWLYRGHRDFPADPRFI